MAKNYEELTITDDFMFGKVMEDKVLCRDLLECLLGQPVGELQDVQSSDGSAIPPMASRFVWMYIPEIMSIPTILRCRI